MTQFGSDIGSFLDIRDEPELCFDGFGSGCVDMPLVHTCSVVVSQLLVDDIPLRIRGRRSFRNVAKDGLGSILQRRKSVPKGLAGRDRVGGHPSAACILVEIDAGIRLRIQVIEAEVSQLRRRTRGRRSVALTLRKANVSRKEKSCEADDYETLWQGVISVSQLVFFKLPVLVAVIVTSLFSVPAVSPW